MLLYFLWDLVDDDKPAKGSQSNHKKLGTAGLALHYANIISQIDTLVSNNNSSAPKIKFSIVVAPLACFSVFT